MKAYRSRYAEIEKAGATLLAISMDDVETLKKFKASLEAPGRFVADPDGKIVKAFDNKVPVLSLASRTTFVIGAGRKVLSVTSGSDAIDPGGAIQACPLHKPAADAGH